ncbi:MAG: hypothetical protein LIP03_02005 [Bacteroidales bacterium]|nr:hypothetical protein [Bacteroidales bacterium]
MNDIVQGIAVAIVLAICAWWIIKKIRKYARGDEHSGGISCNCGCTSSCPLAKTCDDPKNPHRKKRTKK